jgi:hypothetical protein
VTREGKPDPRCRLIIVRRGEREILKSILHAADHWPPTTAVMLDRRTEERRVAHQRVVVERRRRQRRREPDPIWYTHRFMVVRTESFPVQSVVLSPPVACEEPW